MPERSPAVCRIKAWMLAGLLFNSQVAALCAQTTAPVVFDFVIDEHRLVAGSNVVRVAQGDWVVLRWRSQQPLVLHLHGYDLETLVAPAMPAETRFEAYASGRYPVTVHGSGSQPRGHGRHDTLLYIEIQPR